MENSKIDSATIAAYRAAHYTVLAPVPFVLQVGGVSSRLADVLAMHGASCAAFLTAWNPFSAIVTEGENSAAQNSLMNDLRQLGIITVQGFGQDPAGTWPGEESLLAIGLSLEQAVHLGSKYKQNAIVWVAIDACPELILLR